MKRLMPTGLPGPSSMNSTFGSLISTGLPSFHLEFDDAAAADDLLGRNAVRLLDPRPHELDAAAGDDERLEVVRTKIRQQFDHRLVDALVVRAVNRGCRAVCIQSRTISWNSSVSCRRGYRR